MDKHMKRIINYVVFILFLICIFFSLKWSDIPFPISPPSLIEKLFLKSSFVDPVMLNIVTGYIGGYIVYILTVLVPEFLKREPMNKETYETLKFFYNRSVLTLLLMCKNTCIEEQWKEVIKESDIETLKNPLFIQRLKHIDIQATADTIKIHKDSNETISWAEYLIEEVDTLHKKIEDAFLRYHYYISDELRDIMIKIKSNSYLSLFLECSIHNSLEVTGTDDYKYFDSIVAVSTYNSKGKKSPIFSAENSEVLVDYISLLEELFRVLKKYHKYNLDKDLSEHNYIFKLSQDRAGHYATSIFTLPKTTSTTLQK